jgi:hypothetical protein
VLSAHSLRLSLPFLSPELSGSLTVASATKSTASIEISVLRRVLMACRAMGNVGGPIVAMLKLIKHVIRSCAVSKVSENSVTPIWVGIMPDLLRWWTGSDERLHNQRVNCAFCFTSQADQRVAVAGHTGPQDHSASVLADTTFSDDDTVKRTHTAKIGHLIGTLKAGDRQPSLCHSITVTDRSCPG